MTLSVRATRWLSQVPLAAWVGLLAGAPGCSSGQVAGAQGDASTGDGGGPLGDARSDGGSGLCCPAGYLAYPCAFADGGAGTACHDPTKGCASSLTCGAGCDSVSTTCAGPADSGADAGAMDASQSYCAGKACGATCCPGDTAPSTCASNSGSVCDGLGSCVEPGSATPCATAVDAGACDSGSCAGGPGDAGSVLKWWNTCGDPVCRAPADAGDDAGLDDDSGAPCPVVGSACTTPGQTCGTHNPAIACGAIEICSATDPTRGFGGCPISSRQFKNDIHYVGAEELEQLHEEALHIRLATYNYKGQYDDPTARHLGFIVEDDPRSSAIDRPYDRVDLYGYLSMVVATMQVQEKEIASLRRELDEARQGVCDVKAVVDPPNLRSPGLAEIAK